MPTFRASQETESETRYSALIARLESEVKDAPARYKLKVFLLSTLGYGYPIAILASLLGMIGGTVYLAALAPATAIIIGLKIGAKFIAVPVLVLTYTIFRSLWVRVPAPEGRQIKRTEAPLLFALCGQIRKQLRGPKIHEILITESFNAGVVQVPRLGMFGWQKNYLIIGMPLALALSPKQFEAVVAHEYGHLAGAHGHFSSWVYRMRQTWIRLTEVLEEKAKWGSFLFTRFFKWFSPYFNAYTFVLARTEEYEADRCAAEIVGAGITADALIAVSVWDRALGNSFWPELWQQADWECQPPYLPYGHMVNFFKQPLDAEFKRASLENILTETTSNEDTHPCFSDRVRALGRDPRLPQDHERSAAEYLFDQFLAEFLAELDQTWREDSAPHWREQFQQFMDWRRELAGLQAKAKYRTLNEDELWLQAALTEKIDGDVTALPIYRSLFQAHPEHAGAAFSIGRILLGEEDPQGLEFLETAMDRDSDYVNDACALAYEHLIGRGRETEAGSFEKRAWRHNELENLAQEERDQISADDALIPHTLDPEALEPLTVQLRGVPEIKCAYLMCKKVEYKIQSPVYILVLERPDSWTSIETDRQLIENLAAYLDFPDELFVVTSNFLSSRNRSEFMSDRSAVIYESAGFSTQPTFNGPWQMYVTAGTDFFREGNNAQAEKQFEVALEKAEYFGAKDLRLAETLANLAMLYHHRNACAEAVPLSKRALEIRENILKPMDLELTESLAELASLYRDLEQYENAASLYRRAVEIIECVQGPRHPLLAEYLNHLGVIVRLQGKNAEAKSLCTRALEIYEDTLGPDHLDIACVLDELSLHFENDEKYAEAEDSYERSLKIRVGYLGPDHTDVASSLDRYARFLRISGRLEEAGKMEAQAESIRTPQSLQSNRVEAESVGHIMAWMQRRRLEKRNSLDSNALKYPFYYLPAGVLGLVFFLGMYLISLVHPSASVRLATAIIFLGFVFGSAVLIAQYFRVRYRLETEGLAYRTLLKNRGFMCWTDITRVRYLWVFNWFRIEGAGGKVIHISDQLTSFPQFANVVLRNVPMECMDQSTVNVLELRAAKPLPSV